ncbi:MAG: leucine-rich repeat protein [Clostridia bacterium]|nr:leucine-rich repeat protein [Clostridia bacterium]
MSKTLKKLLSMLLCAALLFGVTPLNGFDGLRLPKLSSWFAVKAEAANEPITGVCGDDLTWEYNPNTFTLTVSGFGTMTDYSYTEAGVTTAPWQVYSQTVHTVSFNGGTSIGACAFYGCTGLTNVLIGCSVTSIESSAFYGCTGLTSVVVGNNVARIEGHAFCGCTGLTVVTIQENTKRIGEGAFQSTALTDVYFQGIMQYEWDYIAISQNNDPLNSALLHFSASYPFSGPCGATAFWVYDMGSFTLTIGGTGEMENYSDVYHSGFKDHVTSATWGQYHQTIRNIVVLNGITAIGNYAFFRCLAATSVTIADSVAAIGQSALRTCPLLTSVSIPSGVRSIGMSAFASCSGLNAVYITDLTAWYSIVFSDASANPLYCAHNLYLNGTLVTEAVFPSNMSHINDAVFCGCTSLTSITIPDNVKSIGGYAFYCCRNVTQLSLGSGLERIGHSSFYGLSRLTSVTIPESVNYIDFDGFNGCNSLTAVHITDMAAWCSIYFGNNTSNPVCFSRNLYLNDELITELVIPDGVTSIGRYAFFNMYSLTDVIMPDRVTSIGLCAFYACSRLAGITIGRGVERIDDDAFYACRVLTTVRITDMAAWLNISHYSCYANPLHTAHHLYLNGSLVTAAVIPAGVTSIKAYAFYGCTDLTDITIPPCVASVGKSAFSGCSSFSAITYTGSRGQWRAITVGEDNYPFTHASLTITGGMADFGSCGSGVTWAYDPDTYTLTVTGEGAMNHYLPLRWKNGDLATRAPWGDYYLVMRTVVINDGVTSIGDYAFCGCSAVTSITIPASVAAIGDKAMFNCVGLETIAIDPANTAFYTDSFGVLYTADSAELVQCPPANAPAAYTVPAGVTVIAPGAFSSCAALQNLTLGGIVTTIGADAFASCSGLTELVVPDSVTDIGNYAFADCTGLRSLVLGDSVSAIGQYAFYNCESLLSVFLPESVASISYAAFSGCTGLTDVYYPGTLQQWNAISIANGNEPLLNARIHRCCGSCGAGAVWELDEVTGVLTVSGSGAMTDFASESALPWAALRESIRTVVIEDGVTSVGKNAFLNCTSLTDVTLGSGVTSIGIAAFKGCSALPGIVMPNSVTSIGSYAFAYCRGLTNAVISIHAASIGNYAFLSCCGLTSVLIPNSVRNIGKSVFSGCNGLREVTIGAQVSLIDTGAFKNCTRLEDVYYPGTSEQWNEISIGTDNDPLTNAALHTGAIYLRVCLDLDESLTMTDALMSEAAAYQSVLWTSSEPNVVTVTNGVVTPIAPGITVIAAQSADRSYMELCVVQVNALTPQNGARISPDGKIFGLNANLNSLDDYLMSDDEALTVSYSTNVIGTGTKVIVKQGDVVVNEFETVIFGDLDGNAWYDGTDSYFVRLVVSGMVSANALTDAQRMAADCNHDGAIDSADVALLEQAGLLLSQIDQTLPSEELQTNSVYLEYCSLIDQSIEINEPNQPTVTEEPAAEQGSASTVWQIILDLFKRLVNFVTMLFSIVVLPK